jgi:protein-disulfide isomerase
MKNSGVLLVLAVLALVVGGYSVTVPSGGGNPPINSNRTVDIVEFSDFQCPYCVAAVPTVKQVLAKYGNRVKFEYKNFPIHTNAWKAAEAYEIASQYGKGMEYHDILFANQNALDVDSLKKYARQVGIPGDEFDRLLDSGAMYSKVAADQAEGERLGVSGTPTFFIDGRMLVGAQPYSEFEKIINEELSK